jgi:hypothetical protein
MQSDSKLLLGVPWAMIFKIEKKNKLLTEYCDV